ncbi:MULTISPECIES: diguanylate cyclase domain-containing protein [Catenuloplanes]|uniref:GGDEF domain-containing protein n=1 Tax=Catenuloplanes niger TaxID=587534 RepID=A0AAE3ZQZ9_9ACTN|nr:diguanylate cyclase [Catenuloplanes niger]MDR7322643.1 GGDEF domain-containing protein [Catenuloplanes niger]
MLLLDLTGFKQNYDQHGHDAGDDVLCAIATLAAKTGAVAGRLGGSRTGSTPFMAG